MTGHLPATGHPHRTFLGLDPRLLLRGLVLIGSFAALGYGLKALGLSDLLGEHWIDSTVRGKGLWGEAAYVGVAAVATAFGVPRQFTCFLGGYAFGLTGGVGWGLLSSVFGCLIAFAYARLLGRKMVAARFPAKITRIDDFLHDNPLSMSLLLRLLPVGSNLITNLAAGVSKVRLVPFVIGSAIGYLPQTVVFCLLGSGVQVDKSWQIGVSILLFVASAILGVALYRRYRHGSALDEVEEAAISLDSAEDQ